MVETVLSGLIGSLVTALVIYGFKAKRDVKDSDFQIQILNQDLRRWIRDRDQVRSSDLERTRSEYRQSGNAPIFTESYDETLEAQCVATRHEWRDEITRVFREYGRLRLNEGLLHTLFRGNKKQAESLDMGDECKAILATWREPVESVSGRSVVSFDDPAWADDEKRIRRFEEKGSVEYDASLLPP